MGVIVVGPYLFLLAKSTMSSWSHLKYSNWLLSNLRAGLHHGLWSQTMEDGLSGVQLDGPNILKNKFTKLLGPSLGRNRMWPKKNDCAPKSECVDFSNICLK